MHYRPLNTMSKDTTNKFRSQRFQYYIRYVEPRRNTIAKRRTWRAQPSYAPSMRSLNSLGSHETVETIVSWVISYMSWKFLENLFSRVWNIISNRYPEKILYPRIKHDTQEMFRVVSYVIVDISWKFHENPSSLNVANRFAAVPSLKSTDQSSQGRNSLALRFVWCPIYSEITLKSIHRFFFCDVKHGCRKSIK